jgi:hypothetical protein
MPDAVITVENLSATCSATEPACLLLYRFNQAIAGLMHDAAEDQGGAETLAEIRAIFV